MKKLNVSQMENVQGGLTRKEAAGDVGCAIAGLTMGLVNPIAGFAFGLGCSLLSH